MVQGRADSGLDFHTCVLSQPLLRSSPLPWALTMGPTQPVDGAAVLFLPQIFLIAECSRNRSDYRSTIVLGSLLDSLPRKFLFSLFLAGLLEHRAHQGPGHGHGTAPNVDGEVSSEKPGDDDTSRAD